MDERDRLRCILMKSWLEIREHQVLETHLNLMSDFTGRREKISTIISAGK